MSVKTGGEMRSQTAFNGYLSVNNMYAKQQSGYRRHHSCETATMKIHNDTLTMVDTRSHVVLLLLDLSAAFDTINHKMLLNKLHTDYNISGKVLKWFTSYLDNRQFLVKINNVFF